MVERAEIRTQLVRLANTLVAINDGLVGQQPVPRYELASLIANAQETVKQAMVALYRGGVQENMTSERCDTCELWRAWTGDGGETEETDLGPMPNSFRERKQK